MTERPLILVSGATGYVGGRLVRLLEKQGLRVRCLARRPEFLESRVAPDTEIVAGDVLDRASLDAALAGVHTAYYLVHSMGAPGQFEELDRRGARNFAQAARAAGVTRIVYLGGLGESDPSLSPHLRSRHEVGEILRQEAVGVQVIEFRASIVIGSGSLSFEMIRALVERLPVMITPRWVRVQAQPIGITDLLQYLVGALDMTGSEPHVFEVGGRDTVSYKDIMREYAKQRGLLRLMVPVPLLTPRLSSLWLGLVTPLYARVGRLLIDSIKHPTLVRDRSALDAFAVRPVGIAEAIASALRHEDRERAATSWASAVSAAGPSREWGGSRFGNRLVDSRTLSLPVAPQVAFEPILRIGGENGWYYGDWLWQLRGWLDMLVGGVGMRRGRPRPAQLAAGDPLDCWRVEACEPPRRLLLTAEMRLPGRAWLEFEVLPAPGGATVRQTAVFDPVGLLGVAYWYAAYPLHQVVFAGMLRGIALAARQAHGSPARPVLEPG